MEAIQQAILIKNKIEIAIHTTKKNNFTRIIRELLNFIKKLNSKSLKKKKIF